MNDEQLDRKLDQAIDALPREIHPGDDLWPEIHKRISASQNSGASRKRVTFSISALAACFVMVVAGALLWPRINSNDASDGLISDTGIYLENRYIASVGFDMDKTFEEKRTVLLSKFGENHALTKNWKDQLEELEDARAAIKASLEDNPENFYLLRALQNIHEQQLNLINRVHNIAGQSI